MDTLAAAVTEATRAVEAARGAAAAATAVGHSTKQIISEPC